MFLMSKLELNVPPRTAAADVADSEGRSFLLIRVPFGEEEADVAPLKLLLPELHRQLSPRLIFT